MPTIRLFQDDDFGLDLTSLVGHLDNRCEQLTFVLGSSAVDLPDDEVVCPNSHEALGDELLHETRDDLFAMVFTRKPYANDYFFESSRNLAIFSTSGWRYLTSLPETNGVVLAVAWFLALQIDNSYRHNETTGCIYDYLWDKTGIDRCMREARVCPRCLARMSALPRTGERKRLLEEFRRILDDLGSASKWETDVVDYWESLEARTTTPPPLTLPSVVNFLPDSDPQNYIDTHRDRIESVWSSYQRLTDPALSTQGKGKAFEDFASDFFQLIRGWRIIEQNARLEDCEVDLIIDISDGPELLRRQMGEHIYVECKNRSKKSNVQDVSHFILNAMNRDLKAGIFFSLKGITGYSADKWRSINDAYRRIIETGRKQSLNIIPLVGEDIEAVRNGANLVEHLRDLLNRRVQV